MGSMFVGYAVASNSAGRLFSTEGFDIERAVGRLFAHQVDLLAVQRSPRESERKTLRVDLSIRKRITVA